MNSALDKVIEYIDYQQVELIAEAKQELSDLRTKVASLEARLAEALERNVNKWQPIETAPKDGTEIRLLGRIKKEYIGHWDKEFSVWSVRPHSEGFFVIMPTHWMPLPKLPEEK